MSKKLIVDIEVGRNGGFVVTHYKQIPNALQRLVGSPVEKENLAFANAKDFVEWLTKWKDSEF